MLALILSVILITLPGCDFAECGSGACGNENSGSINVDLISQESSLPANVSVLFRVDTDEGPVGALDSSAFEIFDDGLSDSQFESEKKFVGREGRFQTSVVLVLDLSGSITSSENLAPLKSASKTFLETALAIDEVEVGIWWFDGEAALKQLVGFTDDEEVLDAAIDSVSSDMSSDASTNLYGAVEQSVSVIENHLTQLKQTDPDLETIGAIALFTDGTDQASRSTESQALQAVSAADAKVSMYSIGLRGEIDEDFLRSVGKNGSVFASNIEDITPRFEEIAQRIQNQANSFYLLEYCSPRRSGASHTLEIFVRIGTEIGSLRTSYSAEGFSGGCSVD